MERIRSYYDADRQDTSSLPTDYQTEQNPNELLCSMCGKSVFVNDIIFDDVKRMNEKTMENTFLCSDCIEAYDETAYQQ